MITLLMLIGLWQTDCIQTQINNRSGHVLEQYEFFENGKFEFARQWFIDSECNTPVDAAEIVKGKFYLGESKLDHFSNLEVADIDFKVEENRDLGLIGVDEQSNFLRISRGMENSEMRNTMLGIFQYKKIR